jgi:hypothetical protein
MDADEKTEETRIAIRLADADPGRGIPETTIFILDLCTYTSTKAIYKTTDVPLIPSSHSSLLSSPLLVFAFSLYLAEFDASAASCQHRPPPHVH